MATARVHFATGGMVRFLCLLCITALAPTTLSGDGGSFGAYPMHGGNHMKQQIALDSNINRDNIQNLETLCTFSQDGSFGFIGYPIIDDNNNAYFSDNSGYKSVDITTCTLNWEVTMVDVAIMFELSPDDSWAFSNELDTTVLVETSDGDKVVLFSLKIVKIAEKGTISNDCNLIALRVEDGALVNVATISKDADFSGCALHGLTIDGQYAYGGTSHPGYGYPMETMYWTPDGPLMWRGMAFKMDINTGEVVARWHSLPEFADDVDTLETELFYQGGSIYPHMSVIDDYFVFGTSNMWNYPKRVEECLMDESKPTIDNANVFDTCGNDRSDNDLYRCLEEGVYANSIIVLNKHTFEPLLTLPTQGVGIYHNYCFAEIGQQLWKYSEADQDKYWFDNDYCAKYNMIPDYILDFWDEHSEHQPSIWSTPGMNYDVSSVATFYHDDIPYAVIGGKSGYLWVIDLDEMEVKLSTKISPWGNGGGSSPFSMAVDPKHKMAIFTARGEGGKYSGDAAFPYTYDVEGKTGCDAGMVYAIDLLTGRTVWQWVHPYMKFDEECFDDCTGDGVTDCMDYKHFDWDWGQCDKNTLPKASDSHTSDVKYIYPPKDDESSLVRDGYSGNRNSMVGPSTINGDLIFIPTLTGEVYVHSVVDGEYIQTLYCPEYEYEFEDGHTMPNREGTRSGQTMVDDYLVFYCGASPGFSQTLDGVQKGDLVVMKLERNHRPRHCCQANTVEGWNGNWNGVCWGFKSEEDCEDNGRKCSWNPHKCQGELKCLLRDVECESNEDCCSGRCKDEDKLCR